MKSVCFQITAATLLFSVSQGQGAKPTPQQIEHFEKNVRPVLVQQCYRCHSKDAKRVRGGLLLDTKAGMLKGGDTGPAIVPGNAKKSLLIRALNQEKGLEMPPKGALPKKVVADFIKWIDSGAPDPRDGGTIVEKSVDLEKGRDFWAFQPIQKPAAPPGPGTEIDRFLNAQRKEKHLTAVAEANPGTLIRRLYFDLLGLPPTPKQLEQWTAKLEVSDQAKRKAVLEQLVDELLASPQFGERWGRHWLDVARFAESNGNSRNATFPHAWRYRDYVIDAFNADTPYDQFLTQQLAGDLLPHKSMDERNRNLIATGFLAIGSKPVIRGRKAGFSPDIVADQIEVTSRAILGLTVACARCHDHKFDPIPTTDYYGLAGIFASSETLYGGGGNNMGGAPATGLHVLLSNDGPKPSEVKKGQRTVAELTARQKEISRELKKLRPKKAGKKKKKPAGANVPADVQKKIDKLTAERQEILRELKQARSKSTPAGNVAMGIRESKSVLEVPVYTRGERPSGSPVSRRFVSVATPSGSLKIPSDQSGRLELAQWLTSPENPLTARVMVNRIWLHLFGEGLVRTPDNFGLNGDRPSHPELLDWLANRFIEDKWSVKQTIRRLVLTKAYQLSDEYHERDYRTDPDNVYLWRHPRRRLEAEAIRDSILAVSGTLDLKRPQGSVVTRHGGKLIQDKLTPDTIHQPSNHRSVYLAILRNGLPEVLEIFDVADPSLVVGRRDVTTVPAQDLYLINSPFVLENAKLFAQHVIEESPRSEDRVKFAYQTALSRDPSEQERARALEFIQETMKSISEDDTKQNHELSGWTAFCQALLLSAEFRFTR